MAERIYFQGYHVGWRLEGYNNVPATVQEEFINLINGDDSDEIKGLNREIEELTDSVADLESQVLEYESLERDLRNDEGTICVMKGEVLR